MNWKQSGVGKIFLAGLVAVAALVFTPAPATAFEVITGEDVGLEQPRKVEGSLYVFGQRITINGAITGDLVCAGQDIEVNGPVLGDIICAGQNIVLNGNVSGDVRIAGQNLTFKGPIDGNVHALAQNLDLTASAEIGRELAFLAADASFWGRVVGDTVGTGNNVALNGQFGRQVNLEVENLTFGPEARIVGDLVYFAPEAFTIEPTRVGGKVIPTLRPKTETARSDEETPASWFWSRVLAITSFLLLALILLQLRPHWLERSRNIMVADPLKAVGLGLIALIIWPLALFLLLITLIGIPVGVLLTFFGIAVLLTSRVIPALWLGQQLVMAFHSKPGLWQSLLVGVPVAWLLFGTPVIGFGLSLISVLAGTGAILQSISWRQRNGN